ncbi:MAG: tetratricopeptide repeat protein [Reyranellaceae bacterium]
MPHRSARARALVALLLLSLAAPAARAGLPEGEAAFARRDWRTAMRELQPLAEQGNARAQYLMGGIALQGASPGQTDEAGAIAWYRKAAAQGLTEAQRELAFLLLNDKPPRTAEAIAFYRQAAERGDAEAAYQLGVLYDRGQGVRPDAAQRNAWWQKAAERNYAPALLALAEMARAGDGMAKSEPMAAGYYRRAAEAGSGPAALHYARALRDGTGIARDPAQAWEWFSFALGLGLDPALREERDRLQAQVPPPARAAAEQRASQRLAALRPAPLARPDGNPTLPPAPVRR